MTGIRRPKKKAGTLSTRTAAKLSQIRKAISHFLTQTERIVQSVSPDALIVRGPSASHRKGHQKKRQPPRHYAPGDVVLTKTAPAVLRPVNPQEQISVPHFREATDDDSYEESHCIREKIEGLLITRLEIRRVKAHGRSAVSPQVARENLKSGLETMAKVMHSKAQQEYELEGVDLLPWAENAPEPGLMVKY